jgi:tripartite-type tricarboxylate transporter receptor subunit TctC
VIQKLSQDVKRSMEAPETRQRAEQSGVEARFLPPAEMNKLLERETATWAQAIKAAHIKLD